MNRIPGIALKTVTPLVFCPACHMGWQRSETHQLRDHVIHFDQGRNQQVYWEHTILKISCNGRTCPNRITIKCLVTNYWAHVLYGANYMLNDHEDLDQRGNIIQDYAMLHLSCKLGGLCSWAILALIMSLISMSISVNITHGQNYLR